MKDSFIRSGIVFLLCTYLFQTVANPDELTTVHLSRKILFPVVEEFKNWLANLPEMSDRANYVIENLKRYNESLIEAEKLQKKAKEYKASGDTIQADLYEAKAVWTVVEAQANELTDVINIPRGIINMYTKRRERDKKIQEQAEKYLELLVYKRDWALSVAIFESKALLYKAEAAQYAADGQLDLAKKYKRAAKKMNEAAKLLAEAIRYKTAGNEIQANLYKARAFMESVVANPKLNRDQIGVNAMKIHAQIDLYKAEAARYTATGREDIARKYTEAAELIFQATLTRFNNEEEALKKITRAENLAEEASEMAADRCKGEFQ